jgi:hypothetical protein
MSKASITEDLKSLCSSTTSWDLSPPKASLTPENCRCSEGFIQNRASGLRRTPIPRTWVNKALGCVFTLLADYQDGAVRVSNRRIGDTAHQGPAYPTEPPAAHRYQVDAQLLGQDDYLLVGST